MIVHTILGLPSETRQDILATMQYLNGQDIQGIKLQLLHVLRGTDLAEDYLKNRFSVYTKEEYLDILTACLEHLRPDLVIHRVTGDGPKNLLIAPRGPAASGGFKFSSPHHEGTRRLSGKTLPTIIGGHPWLHHLRFTN